MVSRRNRRIDDNNAEGTMNKSSTIASKSPKKRMVSFAKLERRDIASARPSLSPSRDRRMPAHENAGETLSVSSEPLLVSYGSGKNQRANFKRAASRRNIVAPAEESALSMGSGKDSRRALQRSAASRSLGGGLKAGPKSSSLLFELKDAEELREREEEEKKRKKQFWTTEGAVCFCCFLTAAIFSGKLWIVDGLIFLFCYHLFKIVRKWAAFAVEDSAVQSLWHFVEKCRQHASKEIEKTTHGGNRRRRQEAKMLVVDGLVGYFGTLYVQRRMWLMNRKSIEEHQRHIEHIKGL